MTEREVLALRAAYVKGARDVLKASNNQRRTFRPILAAAAEYPLPPAKVWRCIECGWAGEGGAVEDASGRCWHFRQGMVKGNPMPIRCYGEVEEVEA